MPDQRTDPLEPHLRSWAAAEHTRCPLASPDPEFLNAVARTRRTRALGGAALISASLAAVTLATLAAWPNQRPARPQLPEHAQRFTPAQPLAPQPTTLSPTTATLFALQRANIDCTIENITLPEPIAMTWIYDNPLGS